MKGTLDVRYQLPVEEVWAVWDDREKKPIGSLYEKREYAIYSWEEDNWDSMGLIAEYRIPGLWHRRPLHISVVKCRIVETTEDEKGIHNTCEILPYDG